MIELILACSEVLQCAYIDVIVHVLVDDFLTMTLHIYTLFLYHISLHFKECEQC